MHRLGKVASAKSGTLGLLLLLKQENISYQKNTYLKDTEGKFNLCLFALLSVFFLILHLFHYHFRHFLLKQTYVLLFLKLQN